MQTRKEFFIIVGISILNAVTFAGVTSYLELLDIDTRTLFCLILPQSILFIGLSTLYFNYAKRQGLTSYQISFILLSTPFLPPVIDSVFCLIVQWLYPKHAISKEDQKEMEPLHRDGLDSVFDRLPNQ